MNLLLFTASYPYSVSAEQTLVSREVEYLAGNFERVILVPERCAGHKYAIPPGTTVEEGYAAALRSRLAKATSLLSALSSPLVYQDILARPALLLSPSALRRLLGFVTKAILTRRWVCDFIERQQLDTGQCIFYTYWLDRSALGIGLAKERYPQIRLVSRVHGYDLYAERHRPAYIPCRAWMLSILDYLFPDSERGARYIIEHYPWFASRCEASLLGVEEPGFVTPRSTDGVFRIVSCSYVRPVKRVDLLIRGIGRAAELRPDQRFEWHHLGDGPLLDAMRNLAHEILPTSVESRLLGYLSLDEIMSFYRDNPVDLFVNVSESEGTPVSIMEVISCGIPVLATAVGGNPEIVSERNGWLLSPNPTPDEVAASILDIVDHPDQAVEKGRASRMVWQAKYHADRNFQAFVDRLKMIRAYE